MSSDAPEIYSCKGFKYILDTPQSLLSLFVCLFRAEIDALTPTELSLITSRNSIDKRNFPVSGETILWNCNYRPQRLI